MKRKIKIKVKKRNLIILVLLLLIISIFFSFRFINNKVKPVMMEYAKEETTRLATLVINSAVSKQVSDNFSIDDLFYFKYDNNNSITSIDFNSIIVNKFLTTTTSSVELNLKYIEQGKIELLELEDVTIKYDKEKLSDGIIYELPLGYMFENALLTNILPKVPVKMNLVGSVTSNIDSKITNYGINNAMIEVYIHLDVNIKVILPLMSDLITVSTDIPIAMKLIQGNVPEYYSGSHDSNLSIPIQ